MATQIKTRRGSFQDHQTFTGAVAELTVDTTNNDLVVHDAIKPGGHGITLRTFAIANDWAYDEVIYSIDITTILDDIEGIFNNIDQSQWLVPMLNGTGETLISVIGDQLTTTGGVYTMTPISFSPLVKADFLPLSSNIDMHFGVLLGVSAVNPQGDVQRGLLDPISAGDMEMTLTLTSPFLAGSLICYLADDDEWYSTIVHSVSGALIKLKYEIKADCSVSKCIVSNFMRDSIHPNQQGYNAVIDYALRESLYETTKLQTWSTDFYQALPVGGAPLAQVAPALYENPGYASLVPLQVTCSAIGRGVQTPPLVANLSGNMLVKIYMNTGVDNSTLAGAAEGLCQTKIEILDGSFTIATRTVSSRSACSVEKFVINKLVNSNLVVRITSLTGNDHLFWISKIDIHSVDSAMRNLNKGIHVITGDSWTVGEGISPRLKERLPDVTFIDSGVSGDKSSDTLGNWGGSVAQHNPDFIWLLVGTNDFYGSITAEAYNINIDIMTGLAASTGANLVYFSASVGEESAGVLSASRQYALTVSNTRVIDDFADVGVDNSDYQEFEISIPFIALDPNTSYTIGNLAGTAIGDVLIDYAFFKTNSDSFVDIKLGFNSTLLATAAPGPVSTPDGQVTITTGAIVEDIVAPNTSGSSRFCTLIATNTSGSNLNITGLIRGRWKHS